MHVVYRANDVGYNRVAGLTETLYSRVFNSRACCVFLVACWHLHCEMCHGTSSFIAEEWHLLPSSGLKPSVDDGVWVQGLQLVSWQGRAQALWNLGYGTCGNSVWGGLPVPQQ
jgi:hypothetical protein